MNNVLKITSVSWIEASRLPHAGTLLVAGGMPYLGSWTNRVVLGLVATSNATPPEKISHLSYIAQKQHRAFTHFELFPQFPNTPKNEVIDEGTTPPFDSSKVDTFLRMAIDMKIPDEARIHQPGFKSTLSHCVAGKLHPSSTLILDQDTKVLASMLIKFKAGEHTNKIGISKDVGSPVHVPWVWCEHAIVKREEKYLLIANGSIFPSHTWYANGTKVATKLQNKIIVSEKEPAISTGRPKNHPISYSESDKSKGPVDTHEYAIKGSNQIEVDLTMYTR